jgi:NAD(P)H-quinone oxidoreductase subunit 5
LGLVFIAVGLGQIDIAIMLLFTHAMAKALMFMSIGAIIFTINDQNITEMGGLWSKMPATTTAFAVGAASLTTLAPMGIFWTMQRWSSGLWEFPLWLLGVLIVVNGLSAFNYTRVFRLVFLGKPQPKTRRAPEVIWPMAIPMMTLTVVTLLSPLVPQRWNLWLSPTSPMLATDSLYMTVSMPLLMAATLLGVVLGLTVELRRAWALPAKKSLRFLQDFLAYDFYIAKIYELTVVWAVNLASRLSSWFDEYVIDGAVNFVGIAAVFSGQALRYSASGQSQFYILTILISVGLLLLLTMNWLV